MLTQPEQISAWYYLSAVSQLSLELATGRNYYGKTSVYKGIRERFMPALPARATKHNKIIALANLVDSQPDSPVFQRARKILDEVCEAEGIELVRIDEEA